MLNLPVTIPSREATSTLNQAVERVQPCPLTDDAMLSPEAVLSNLLARKLDALASVRRLQVTGKNKSFWRLREAEILAEIERLGQSRLPLSQGEG